MKLAKSPKLRYKFIWAKVMHRVALQLVRIYAAKWERAGRDNLVISHSGTANEVTYTFNWDVSDFKGLVILLDPETAEPIPFQPIRK